MLNETHMNTVFGIYLERRPTKDIASSLVSITPPIITPHLVLERYSMKNTKSSNINVGICGLN